MSSIICPISTEDGTLFAKETSFNSEISICSDKTASDGYSSDHSSNGNADHPDCNTWGSNAFEENGGIMEFTNSLGGACNIREMPACYDKEALVRELAASTTTDNAFFVIDLTAVMRKVGQWKEYLPRVKPHYAVKCNNDQIICRMLAQAGCGFDCASQAELEQCLAMGVAPSKLIYANPCKQANMLRFARNVGVHRMTADNVDELDKIARIFPEAHVVLRIAVDDSKSLCRFNSKFGAPPQEWDQLLITAKNLGLNVVGISFHVGSGCGELQPFADAVSAARDAFDLAKSYGFHPNLLDVGGGWPGDDDGNFTFSEVAGVVGQAIDEFFPASSGVEIIAEPGRYFAHASHTYAVAVIAKRQLSDSQLADTAEIESFGARASATGDGEITQAVDDGFKKAVVVEDQPKVALYINDGVYGSFNCVVFDHAHVYPKALDARTVNTVPTKLFGPTCDSIDVVKACTNLPEMHVGDWLMFNNMGAYTRCAASRFNGQGAHDLHYIWAGMP